MKHYAWIFLLLSSVMVRAELPYKLPPKAKYTASAESIAKAKANLSTNLVADPVALTNLFSPPTMCGPGLWDVLKSSPHFSKPPVAKTTVKVRAGGKTRELPAALLQDEGEVASFRKALADLLRSQGTLTFREPSQDEFMTFWTVIPFDKISGPILVAEGKEVTIFCEFGEFDLGKVFWADEVKRMHLRK